jgi:hypothetical protein
VTKAFVKSKLPFCNHYLIPERLAGRSLRSSRRLLRDRDGYNAVMTATVAPPFHLERGARPQPPPRAQGAALAQY